MASLKKLLSDSVIYGLSSIVGRFLNYLLVPVYTYHISAASGGYGVVTNVYAYTALLLVILTFGMETTFFYYANREGLDRRRVFCTALGSVGSVCLLFVALVMVFIGPIAQGMGYPDHPEYIRDSRQNRIQSQDQVLSVLMEPIVCAVTPVFSQISCSVHRISSGLIGF